MSDYQDKSIVSQLIINKKSGSITLFSFDKDQGLSKHNTPYDAFVLILEGIAEIIIEDDKFILKQGQTIVMPKNIPHAINAIKRFKMILILIE